MGACRMRWHSTALVLLVVAGLCRTGLAQSPTYGVGKAPTPDELRAWDISVSPTGKELPQGHGTAVEGARLYVQKGCAGCHGPTGSGGKAPILIKRETPSTDSMPCLSPCIRDSPAGPRRPR